MEPKVIQKHLPVRLSPEDLAKTAEQMARVGAELGEARLELERCKARAKQLPERIAELETDLLPLCETYNHGTEQRLVDCEEQPDFEAKVVRLLRLDTRELLPEFERPMTAKERQTSLFDAASLVEALDKAEERDSQAEAEAEAQPDLENLPGADEYNFNAEFAEETEADDPGTPTRTLRTVEELEEWGDTCDLAKLDNGLPYVERIYVDGNPFIVTGESGNGLSGVQSLSAYACLPLSIAGEPFKVSPFGEPGWYYDRLRVNCGTKKKPDYWVMLGPEIEFRRAPEPETAPALPESEALCLCGCRRVRHTIDADGNFTGCLSCECDGFEKAPVQFVPDEAPELEAAPAPKTKSRRKGAHHEPVL